jgi:hypothetical protein
LKHQVPPKSTAPHLGTMASFIKIVEADLAAPRADAEVITRHCRSTKLHPGLIWAIFHATTRSLAPLGRVFAGAAPFPF